MKTGTSKRATSTGDAGRGTTETDHWGPLINGRPILEIQDVQRWCRSAHIPCMNDTAAAKVAGKLNLAAALRTQWAPEFADFRKANLSTQRMGRIANALATLLNDLPGVLKDSRAVKPDADVSVTEALLDLVQKHKPIIDKYRHRRGRPRDLAGNVAANIGTLVTELCDDPNRITEKARDAFVTDAMAWLLLDPPANSAISRSRRRRATLPKSQLDGTKRRR